MRVQVWRRKELPVDRISEGWVMPAFAEASAGKGEKVGPPSRGIILASACIK